MPKDTAIAKALVAAINAADLGRIKKAEFSYDPFYERDDWPDDVQVFVMPDEFTRVRLSRGGWQKDCKLLMGLRVMQGPNDTNAEAFIDRWLDDFDALMDFVGNTVVEGHLALTIEQDTRYDRELLNSQKQLVCLCEIAYKVI